MRQISEPVRGIAWGSAAEGAAPIGAGISGKATVQWRRVFWPRQGRERDRPSGATEREAGGRGLFLARAPPLLPPRAALPTALVLYLPTGLA